MGMGGGVVMQSTTSHKWEVLASYYLGKFLDMWFIEDYLLIHSSAVDISLVKVTLFNFHKLYLVLKRWINHYIHWLNIFY